MAGIAGHGHRCIRPFYRFAGSATRPVAVTIGRSTSFVGCVNPTFLEGDVFRLVDMQRRTLDRAASANRVVVASVAAEGIRIGDMLCMTTAQTTAGMAGGTCLRAAAPERGRCGAYIVEWSAITVTVQIRTTAKYRVVLAGKVVVGLTAIAAARDVERIFRRYDQVTSAGAGGMLKGGMIGVTFDTLVSTIVIIVMSPMTSSRTAGCTAGRRSSVTAVAITGSGECIRSPHGSGAFKMTVDVGTATEKKSAGFVGGLGKRGVIDISG